MLGASATSETMRRALRGLLIALAAVAAATVAIAPADAAKRHAAPRPRIDAIWVYKGERTLTLVRRGEIVSRYPIALGADPVGPKHLEGDKRTPEGRYTIDWRNPDSRFHKALHISYPNDNDLRDAERVGVNPGGMVMIHGMPSAPELRWLDTRGDWTDGCIAVSNTAMDEIWNAVADGTPVIIEP
jgi:murein L,D-transpeptidase YafK